MFLEDKSDKEADENDNNFTEMIVDNNVTAEESASDNEDIEDSNVAEIETYDETDDKSEEIEDKEATIDENDVRNFGGKNSFNNLLLLIKILYKKNEIIFLFSSEARLNVC